MVGLTAKASAAMPLVSSAGRQLSWSPGNPLVNQGVALMADRKSGLVTVC